MTAGPRSRAHEPASVVGRPLAFARVLVPLCLAACSSGASLPTPTPTPAPAPRPAPAGLDRAELATSILGRARAQLFGGDAPVLAAAPAQVVYLCAYGSWPGARCGRGHGADLMGSVDAAIAGLRQRHRALLAGARPEDLRLKIDVVTSTRAAAVGERLAVQELGRVGLLAPGGAYLLPSELLELGLVSPRKGTLRSQRLNQALARRGSSGVQASTKVSWFHTVSWVEGADLAPTRLYRVHAFEAPAPSAELLLQRSVWAADHLARIVGDNGKIRYHYDVVHDRALDDYNLLRHGGSIYALLQAYERVGYEPWRAAGERAIGFLLRATQSGERRGPHGGGAARFVVSPRSTGPTLKLGGTALALLALDQYQQATGDQRYLERARELGRFLVAAQKRDGEFHSYLPVNEGDPTPDRVSIYYPGEAILALLRLYEWDPNPVWLGTARRGADWLIDVRDRGLAPDQLATDHWLMIGLSHLYRHTADRRYVDHSIALAKSVLPNYRRGLQAAERYRDYRGGFYSPPRSTPAATRAEGLVAVLDTCAAAEIDCAWVLEILVATVRHMLQAQYTPDVIYWVLNPSAVAGGFMGGITDSSIRNDFVQHALSALLGLERQVHRRAGKTLPGGPSWNGSSAHQRWTPLLGVSADELRRFGATLPPKRE